MTGSLGSILVPRRSFDTVIYDTRFEVSRNFADRWARPATARGIAGDVNRLWFDEIGPQWSRGGGAIAGMTTPAALFCLEQLAKDHWRRVVMRHELRSTTTAPHVSAVPSRPGIASSLVSWIIA
jgi:hypothetical protein